MAYWSLNEPPTTCPLLLTPAGVLYEKPEACRGVASHYRSAEEGTAVDAVARNPHDLPAIVDKIRVARRPEVGHGVVNVTEAPRVTIEITMMSTSPKSRRRISQVSSVRIARATAGLQRSQTYWLMIR